MSFSGKGKHGSDGSAQELPSHGYMSRDGHSKNPKKYSKTSRHKAKIIAARELMLGRKRKFLPGDYP